MVNVDSPQRSEYTDADSVIPPQLHSVQGFRQPVEGLRIGALRLAAGSGIIGDFRFLAVPLLIPPAAEQAGFPQLGGQVICVDQLFTPVLCS